MSKQVYVGQKKRKVIKNKPGREKDYKKEDILKAIKDCGGILNVVAKRLGCAMTTVVKYINMYPETVDAFESERVKMIDLAEEVVFRKIRRGDVQTAKWFLSRKAKDRGYGDEVGLSGGINIDIDLKPFAEMVKQKLLEEKIDDGK